MMKQRVALDCCCHSHANLLLFLFVCFGQRVFTAGLKPMRQILERFSPTQAVEKE